MHPVSTESSASSSASELARTLEDATVSLFRFLGTVLVPLAELPAACEAGPDASVGAETWFLYFLSDSTQPRRDPGALLRADKVFTPFEEVQLLKARVEY